MDPEEDFDSLWLYWCNIRLKQNKVNEMWNKPSNKAWWVTVYSIVWWIFEYIQISEYLSIMYFLLIVLVVTLRPAMNEIIKIVTFLWRTQHTWPCQMLCIFFLFTAFPSNYSLLPGTQDQFASTDTSVSACICILMLNQSIQFPFIFQTKVWCNQFGMFVHRNSITLMDSSYLFWQL